MKNALSLLIVLILLQSCNVYHSPTSVEEAVAAEKKLKLITKGQKKYKFKRLEREDQVLFGVARTGSSSAKELSHLVLEKTGSYSKIDLSQVNIDEVRLRNEAGSTVLNIAVSVAAVFAILIAANPSSLMSFDE